MWKAVKWYEGLYEVSDCGRVRSLDRIISQTDRWTGRLYKRTMLGKELNLKTDRDGYKLVILSKGGRQTTFKVHRLVAGMFLENPEGKPQVNHIDVDKANNNVGNLEWCTDLENTRHAIENGLFGGFQCSA